MRACLLLLFSPALLLTGCGHSDTSTDALPLPPESATASPLGSDLFPAGGVLPSHGIVIQNLPAHTIGGTFLPYRLGATAVTYNPAVVPPGATAEVEISTTRGRVRVRLRVAGLIPRRGYGAHLHTMPCSALPDAAGPHYQHHADPSKPSVDPAYANPRNEIWLDFTADTAGSATVTAVQAWSFTVGRAPRSLVLHAQGTRTGTPVAGTAGPRVACLTLPAG